MTKTNNSPVVNVNPVQGEDSPAVLAYRMGQAEKAIKEGFRDLAERLDLMSRNFATHKDVETLKQQGELEHELIRKDIEDVREDVKALKKKNWIQNTLSAIFGAVLAFLLTHALSGIFK